MWLMEESDRYHELSKHRFIPSRLLARYPALAGADTGSLEPVDY